ncbi:hypothetical protein AB0N28_29475 [Streptomyces sp. NPDC051130]|uniref:hypothetical protein n=1 Tax=Streptomyces sp. NPDC051130 TaxID=3157223 RepID=UPI0034315AA6
MTTAYTALVLGRNYPEDPETEYFITHCEWGRHGHLATVSGHQAGPGLSWRELHHIARTPDLNTPGVHAEYARLLLLLPALGDRDLPEDAAAVVGGALTQAGAPAALAPPDPGRPAFLRRRELPTRSVTPRPS